METHDLTCELLSDALAALQAAAGDLILAAVMAPPGGALAMDARVLALAVEREAEALDAVLARCGGGAS